MTTPHPIKAPKKLIEVALPLDAINAHAAKEKGNPFLKGHPRNLHQWWARRPQAVARAVIFAQMVNDPSWKWELEHSDEVPPSNLKASWAATRKRLFTLLDSLAKWENSGNTELFEQARAEIQKSWRETCETNQDHPDAAEIFDPTKMPAFYDPFAGGGAIPLEAQRLGLETHASDLNPVAVLINKVMIELPPKFAGLAPVNPDYERGKGLIAPQWQGARGLADDLRYYAQWMRDEAHRRIGHLYPPVRVHPGSPGASPESDLYGGQDLPVMSWIWVRTVKSPSPAFRHVDVPLASTFILSGKEDRQVWVSPEVEGDRYHFVVRSGHAPSGAKSGTKLGRGANFRCLLSGVPIEPDHIKAEGQSGRLGVRLMAIVAIGERGRVYLPPQIDLQAKALAASPGWRPTESLPLEDTGNFWCSLYGLKTYGDLFTQRQLVALTTLSDLVTEVIDRVRKDAAVAGMADDAKTLAAGGRGALAYAQALGTLTALALDKLADYSNAMCTWNPTNQNIGHLFTKQAIPMSWDFAEASPFDGGLSFAEIAVGIARSIERLPASTPAYAFQHSCGAEISLKGLRAISTDPPYYDNVGYADLSDFFYVWLRRSLRSVFPDLFATLTTPKAEELVATPFRHGGKERAETFFLNGMTHAMRSLKEQAHPAVPVSIYYAFKQSESHVDTGTASTGWETFLEAVIRAGFSITGTWPMRTERGARAVGLGTNALASSIILVCRPRPVDSSTISRREFQRELNRVLPLALDEMTRGAADDRSPVAPVDLSQSIIGPGMAVFSKYSAVLEADGTPMSVRTAMQLINRFMAEDDFDHDTQFCLHWFEQYGWKDGRYGEAETLARAKGTAVDGVKQAGVLFASGGVVRLLKWTEYPANWDPATDSRLPVWEALHQIIRVFTSDGEHAAGAMLSAIENRAESIRQLAYRLYTLCERAGWAEDARAYNEIITSWTAIESAAAATPTPKQTTLFG